MMQTKFRTKDITFIADNLIVKGKVYKERGLVNRRLVLETDKMWNGLANSM